MRHVVLVNFLLLCGATMTFAQSSSLYIAGPEVRQEQIVDAQAYYEGEPLPRLSPAIAQSSLVAVPLPAPRRFAVQDLVTVIIREESQAKWGSELQTDKSVNWNWLLAAFPDLQQLLEFTLAPGMGSEVEIDMAYDNQFDGAGDLQRKEVMTGRVQARIIDIKPNGTLVLEARKYNQVDEESISIVLTGICRAEDVTVDNTILSSELYDLNLVKTQEGDLRRASQKGLWTKLMDLLLNF